MAKNIIILNGSPRPKGNTSALTAEFKKGAEEAGNKVTEFQLSRMKINGCIGCWGGGKDSEHPCSQRDDMDKIYPLYYIRKRMWWFLLRRYTTGLFLDF